MEQKILAILQDINPYVNINLTSKLLEEDILDSLGIILLMDELEAKFKIAIPYETVKKEDFQTIESVAKLVSSLI